MSQSADTPVIDVSDLKKTFFIGFFRKRVDAVRGISFSVSRGQIFGLLGPNGAGKTTTIKMLLRLIFPSSGNIKLFGQAVTADAMVRVGYMPENPYIYQYLRPLEFLDLCGQLMGMTGAARRKRGEEMIELVGLSHALGRPIGKFSKGMMQRVGLAQALLHEPDVLILDEPMSGLDPIGRKHVRDLLFEQRRKGRTLVFTSHILSDVERLCDTAVIMSRGTIQARGTMDELLASKEQRIDIELSAVDEPTRTALEALADEVHVRNEHHVVVVEGRASIHPVLDAARDGGAQVEAVTPRRERLEDLFVS